MFPASGYGGNLLIRLHHLFLPALTVALALSPFLIRNLRSSMIREMAADHVTAVRSRGLPERAIFRNHVFLNALISRRDAARRQHRMARRHYRGGGTGIHGSRLGRMIVGSIVARDYLVVQAIAMLMAIGILMAKFLFDIATVTIDRG